MDLEGGRREEQYVAASQNSTEMAVLRTPFGSSRNKQNRDSEADSLYDAEKSKGKDDILSLIQDLKR